MKKLLLVAAILAISATAFGAHITKGTSDRPVDNAMYPVNLMDPRMSVEDGILTSQNGGHHGTGAIPFNISEGHIDYRNGINIFLLKGDGWRDEATTNVTLKVLKKVSIMAESANIYTEAVVGDKISFGDLGFRVEGASDTRVKFKFEGPLFESGLQGGASLWAIGGGAIVEEENFDTMAFVIPANEEYMKEFEVDLYFDLAEAEAKEYEGVITAIAKYQ